MDESHKRSPFDVPEEYTGDETIDDMLHDVISVLHDKGMDYTQGNLKTDRLHAFRTAAETLGLSMEEVWGVYYYKHHSALMRYLKDGKTESEPVDGRIMDMIAYLLLLYKIIKQPKPMTTEQIAALCSEDDVPF